MTGRSAGASWSTCCRARMTRSIPRCSMPPDHGPTGMKAVARAIRAATARSIAGRAAEPRCWPSSPRTGWTSPRRCSLPRRWTRRVGQGRCAASEEVAAFIRTIRGDVAAPAPEPAAAAEPPPPKPARPEEPVPSIGEMVARIERLKSKREDAAGRGRGESRRRRARPSRSPGPTCFAGNATRRARSVGSKGRRAAR